MSIYLRISSKLIKEHFRYGVAFCGILWANILLLMISGIFYGVANACLYGIVNVHEPEAQTGAVAITSSGLIGGSVFSLIYGPIVASFPAADLAYASRFVVVIPAAVLTVVSFAFLLLKFVPPPARVRFKREREATFQVKQANIFKPT